MMMATVENILSQAKKMIGITQYSEAHKQLVHDYNSVKPLPSGYAVNYDDDWCDIFITTLFIRANASHLVGRECGVERHIDIFKTLGIWYEDGNLTPKKGDIITFNWDTTTQPNNGFADHIGIVEKIEKNIITTIEGNSSMPSMVRRNTYNVGAGVIRGYARPNYSNTATEKPVKWNKDLSYGGNRLKADYINTLIEIGNKYNVLPSFLICQLYLESNWGNSPVARENNNLAGMTWSGNPNRESGVIVQQGSPRPANEGSHYIKYNTVDDFFIDWSYLYRLGGIYNVSGKNFENAVKGLFIVGGAKYDYAASGYNSYINLMRSIKAGIEKENGQNILNQIDQLALNGNAILPPETPGNTVNQYYTVQSGDSLWKIAQHFNLTVDQLCTLNNISQTSIIHPGDKLIVKKGTVPAPQPSDNTTQYYIVKTGDSLWGIAQRFNLSVDQLCALNNISQNSMIHPGDKLIVKQGTSISPQPKPSETLINSYSEAATFTANTTIAIRNNYSTNSPVVANLSAGDSVHYDSVYITAQYVWISYISYSGIRRFVAIRTYNNGNLGTLWGTIS